MASISLETASRGRHQPKKILVATVLTFTRSGFWRGSSSLAASALGQTKRTNENRTLAASQPSTGSSGICGEGSLRTEEESDQALTQRKS